MNLIPPLLTHFDPDTGAVEGVQGVSRRLADMEGVFANRAAFEEALRRGNPVVYTVSSITPAEGTGQLHYGIGVLHPGVVGDEYYMTKGHFHSRREAAEVYIGLRGKGTMLLETGTTGESAVIDLLPDSIVYVPGDTAHRTVNVGPSPLIYIGIYPADAGHDYEAIRESNFRTVIIAENGKPAAMDRKHYLNRTA